MNPQPHHYICSIIALCERMLDTEDANDRRIIRDIVRKQLDDIERLDVVPVVAVPPRGEPKPEPKNCHSCAMLGYDGFCNVVTGNVDNWQRENKPRGGMPKRDAPPCPCFKARS